MNLQTMMAEFETRGKVRFQGMTIRIENPRDSVRSGKDKKTGKKWSTTLTYPYGCIEGTVGVDGDEVDCFVGPENDAKLAHVIHILNQHTGDFDEDKVMLGWHDAREAKDALLQNYDGEHFYGSMDSMGMAEFKKKVFATKDRPALIKAAQLQRTLRVYAKAEITIGDQVIVDGVRNIGEVYGIKGRRYSIRFKNGLSLSRDLNFVRLYQTPYAGMWKDQQKT